MAIWLPGYTRVNLGLSGKPFEYRHNPKGLLHSTEGTSLAGAEQAMRAYPSHLGYDYRTREKHQYISLDLAAYSAMDESDNDPIYQVELVGFAKDMRYLPDWALRNIAEDVIKPLANAVGIPPVTIWHGFKDGLDGIYPYLASPQSPIRLSYAQLRNFSGWLGHQHLPAPDDHWDPGAINMARLIALAYGDDDAEMISPETQAWLLNNFLNTDGDRRLIQAMAARVEALAKCVGNSMNGPAEGEYLQGPVDINETKWRLHDLLHLKEIGDRDRVIGEDYPLVTMIKRIDERITSIETALEARTNGN